MLVKNIHSFVTYVNSTFFIPGINNIPAAKAKELVKTHAFQEKVKLGSLVIVNNDGDDNIEIKNMPSVLPTLVSKIAKTDIKTMGITAAIKVIKETFNVAELRELLKKETRRTVKLAIKTQLKNIDNAAKKKDTETDNTDSNVYED